jgi:hypothetical protein
MPLELFWVASKKELPLPAPGFIMKISPITADHAEQYLDIMRRTSDEDRYCRFFATVKHFDRRSISKFVDSQPDLIGFSADDDAIALGAAHAFLDGSTAELAIVVAGDARHHHVGLSLMVRLIEELRLRSCHSIVAHSLHGNGPFRHLARSLGMSVKNSECGVLTWKLAGRKLASRKMHNARFAANHPGTARRSISPNDH